MLWSILIPGIPERYHTVQPLLLSLLEHQAVARIPDIELLYLMDNKRRTVGEKRNALLSMAKGEFISFIDDDDGVATTYVERIHRAIGEVRKTDVDVICFRQDAILKQHGVTHECSYSLEFAKREPKRQLAPGTTPNALKWSGPPAHTMVWRRDLAQASAVGIKFPDIQFGEDTEWVDRMCLLARKEHQIVTDFPLYIYTFDEQKTSTRG